MVVVLMFVRIPWSKVKVSRAHAKGHPVLLIRTAVLSNAVSFHYFHNIIPPTVNIKLIAKTRNIFCRIFQIFLIASTRWNQNFKNLLNEIRIDITLRFRFFPKNTDCDFKLTNAQLIMVVVLMFVRIPWTKVTMSRVPVKRHLLLLIPTAVNSNAVSFNLFHIYITLISNYEGNCRDRKYFRRIF